MSVDAVDREARLNAALAAYVESAEAGLSPDPGDWIERHPDLRADLEEFFALRATLDGALSPVRRAILGATSLPLARTLPTHFAGYDLLEELGTGGMGVVYKARQHHPPRVVALKMIRAGRFATAADRRRFCTEVESAALLDHPRIVPVYQAGEAEGHPYLAMRLLEGGPLTGHLPGLRGRPRDAARLVLALAEAVKHAHDRGVLHRDIKPSNVLLDLDGRPHLTDFGLAKLSGADAALTRTGEVIGALPYVAPELAAGKPGAATTATDVYGLGAVLYACLTGRPPGRGETTAAVLECVLHGEPERPRRVDPLVPRDLEAVCLKCLEREPGRRYASAGAVTDDLRRYLDGRPTRARPLSPAARGLRWARRRPDLAALTALATVAVLAAVIVGGWLSVRLAVARAETEAAARVASSQEYFAVVERARQRRFESRVGWTRESLAELGWAARLPPAADRLPELRTEAAACLAAVDLRRVRTLSEHFPVYALSFSHDGKLAVARYSPDGAVGRVRLIDPEDGRVLRELTYATDPKYESATDKTDGAREVAFSPDGRWLVASSRGGWLHRWDLTADAARAVSWQPYLHEGKPLAAALRFGVTPPVLFTRGGSKGSLQCWDMADGWTELYGIRGRYAPAVDPVDGRIASADGHRVHLQTGVTLGSPSEPKVYSHLNLGDMWASPTGRIAAAVNADRGLLVVDIQTGLVLRSLAVPGGEIADPADVTDVAFSPDGSLLACASEWSRRVKVWDVASGRLVADFAAGGGGSMRIAFRLVGRELVVAADRKVVVYEVDGGDVVTTIAVQPHPLAAAALSPDGRSLACLTDKVIQGPGMEPSEEVSRWPTAAPGPAMDRAERGVVHSGNRPVAALLASGGLVFSTRNGLELRPADNPAPVFWEVHDVKSIAAGPDGRLWAAAGDDVRAFALPGRKETATWSNHAEDSRAGRVFYSIAPGTAWVLAGRRDGRVFLFDPAARHHATWTVGDQPVSALVLHEAAGLVAAGDEAGQLRVFRVPTGEVVVDLTQAHRDAIMAAAITPDGRLLATGGRDRAIRLWRTDGTPVMALPALGPVKMLAFSPTGAELYALVDGERGVRRWHLNVLADRLREQGIDPGDALPGTSWGRRSRRQLAADARFVARRNAQLPIAVIGVKRSAAVSKEPLQVRRQLDGLRSHATSLR